MHRAWKIFIVTTVLGGALGSALIVRHLSTPRIVGRSVTPEGVELCVVQKCNWEAEPFTTSFVFRKPGGQWGWFYYDHQDWYWGHARIVLDTNSGVARVFRGETEAITFNWRKEIYTMHRWRRTIDGPQGTMPPGWEPTMD
jgi:hypothetical protein